MIQKGPNLNILPIIFFQQLASKRNKLHGPIKKIRIWKHLGESKIFKQELLLFCWLGWTKAKEIVKEVYQLCKQTSNKKNWPVKAASSSCYRSKCRIESCITPTSAVWWKVNSLLRKTGRIRVGYGTVKAISPIGSSWPKHNILLKKQTKWIWLGIPFLRENFKSAQFFAKISPYTSQLQRLGLVILKS